MKSKILLFTGIFISSIQANFNFDAIFHIYSQNEGNSWQSSGFLSEFAGAVWGFRISYVAESSKVYIPSIPGLTGNEVIVWYKYSYNSSYFQYVHVGTFSGWEWGDTFPRLSITSYDMDTVFLVWGDKLNDTLFLIKFSRSFDSCNTWSPEVAIFDLLKNTPQAFLKYSPPYLHLIWRNKRRIYYSKSKDYGATWNIPIIISQDTISFKRYPVMDVKNNFIAVAWQDFRNGKSDIYYNFSVDTGNTWFGMDISICVDTGESFFPDLEIDSSFVYASWTFVSDFHNIGFGRSENSGITWSKKFMNMGYYPFDTMYTSITSRAGNLYLAWSPKNIGSDDPDICQLFFSPDAGVHWYNTSPSALPPGACMEIYFDKSGVLHIGSHIYVIKVKENYNRKFVLPKKINSLILRGLNNYQNLNVFDVSGRILKSEVNLTRGIKFVKEKKNKKYLKIVIF